MSENWVWLEVINRYVNDGFLLHEEDLKASQRFNRFLRWWLEQIRNLLVVSAFYFIAYRSDSLILKALANVTYFLFFGYFVTWTNNFSFRFLPYIKNPKMNFWINGGLWICLCMPVFIASSIAIGKVMLALTTMPPRVLE
jgi:hypothetical protein